MATDVEIGRNVTRIRAGMSQKDLADAMRELGFRWSQATVWAVEKGERPLRLAEAEGLGRVLKIHHTVLLSTTEEINLIYRFRELNDLFDEIEKLAFASFESQRFLAMAVDWHPASWDDDDDSLDVIARTAVDAAVEGLVRAEAHYRGLREVTSFPEPPDAVQSPGKYSDTFLSAVEKRLADERSRIRAARAKEAQDGVDQTT